MDKPWLNEPNREKFRHVGFDCLIKKNPNGSWCGYVAVTKETPLYGISYQLLDCKVEVHGGLTYSEECQEPIYYKTENEDKAWWFGFDCAHYDDYVPGLDSYLGYSDTRIRIYKDIEYVKKETKSLAEQFKKIIGEKS